MITFLTKKYKTLLTLALKRAKVTNILYGRQLMKAGKIAVFAYRYRYYFTVCE